MKKLEKSNIIYGNELEKLVIDSLEQIKSMIEKNNYIIESSENFNDYMNYNYSKSIKNSSKKMIKKLNRYIRFLVIKGNMESANRLLHFIKIKFAATRTEEKIGSDFYNWISVKWIPNLETVKIKKSIKEQTIQKKRDAWKKLRDEAERSLLDYKKEKGDFYKNIMYESLKEKELQLA